MLRFFLIIIVLAFEQPIFATEDAQNNCVKPQQTPGEQNINPFANKQFSDDDKTKIKDLAREVTKAEVEYIGNILVLPGLLFSALIGLCAWLLTNKIENFENTIRTHKEDFEKTIGTHKEDFEKTIGTHKNLIDEKLKNNFQQNQVDLQNQMLTYCETRGNILITEKTKEWLNNDGKDHIVAFLKNNYSTTFNPLTINSSAPQEASVYLGEVAGDLTYKKDQPDGGDPKKPS